MDQTDFRREVETQRYFYTAFSCNPDVIIPRVELNLCTDDIIVMEYVHGRHLTDPNLSTHSGTWV